MFPEGPSSLAIALHWIVLLCRSLEPPSSVFAGRKAETQEGKGAGHSRLSTHFELDVSGSWNPWAGQKPVSVASDCSGDWGLA